ncbi:hypothetical protein [uncultured Erythrobacter sp.]|uniref:hypothetical protein n=1 Tax=uncultured Erythrobacter sp. TaxID=263913 RepID=UPI0026018103|nr:hypothetical protein [uncultured Erythrobacter sp.]
MEKPTIISSGPDAMGRTVCFGDELSRRARYGRIRPMPRRRSLFSRLLSRG